MNKQDKGDGRRGIEWCTHTFNPIAGCLHACQWTMADNVIANCYAEDQAEKGQAAVHYPQGFSHHYWHPERLNEPLSLKKPSKIFIGSMADVFGHWVPAEQIEAVLEVCKRASWHVFIFLTKNPVRLKHFTFPDNCWVGISSPPDFMWGKPLSLEQKTAWLKRSLHGLSIAEARIKWMSIEPLSFDIAPILEDCTERTGMMPLDWAVVGSASNGPVYYQPDPQHLRRIIGLLDDWGVPIYMKGNLRPSLKVATNFWREEFPETHGVETHMQQRLW